MHVSESGMNRRELRHFEDACSRQGRRKTGRFLCEGVRCCTEGIRQRPDWLEEILVSDSFARFHPLAAFLDDLDGKLPRDPIIVPDDDLANLAETENPQGILCLFKKGPDPLDAPPPTDPFVLILDRIAEPGNMGTILRTAWAVGLTQVWLTKGTTDPFGSKAIRAGMGAQFALVFRQFEHLPDAQMELRACGYGRLWISTPTGDTASTDPAFDLAASGLVIGNEATGSAVIPGSLGVRIPMPGQAESLNAAQAATLLVFEGVRRGLLA